MISRSYNRIVQLLALVLLGAWQVSLAQTNDSLNVDSLRVQSVQVGCALISPYNLTAQPKVEGNNSTSLFKCG